VIVPAGLAAPGRAAAGSPGAALAWPAPTASTPAVTAATNVGLDLAPLVDRAVSNIGTPHRCPVPRRFARFPL